MSRWPLEIRVVVAILAGCALAFLLLGVVRQAADPGSLRFPIALLVVAFAAVGGLVARLRFARGAALVAAVLLALAHLLIALGDLPWWVRVASGLIAAAHVYAFVLLMTQPARKHLDPAR